MNLEQAKREWKEAKKAVMEYFTNKGVTIKYDIDTDIATAYDRDNSVICFGNLADEDIIVKLLGVRPDLNSKVLDLLLERLEEAFNNYSKLEVEAQEDMEK